MSNYGRWQKATENFTEPKLHFKITFHGVNIVCLNVKLNLILQKDKINMTFFKYNIVGNKPMHASSV